MDTLVGRIVDTVEKQGIRDKTIIIYTSDTGTTASSKGKGVEYGVHVPFVLFGAEININGLTESLMDFTDILPLLQNGLGRP